MELKVHLQTFVVWNVSKIKVGFCITLIQNDRISAVLQRFRAGFHQHSTTVDNCSIGKKRNKSSIQSGREARMTTFWSLVIFDPHHFLFDILQIIGRDSIKLKDHRFSWTH